MGTPIPLLIDTDGGVDDCLAIVLAMRVRSTEVRGITTTGGNTSVAKATRNAVLATSAGRPGALPALRFGAGEDATLTGAPFLTLGHTYHSPEGLPLPPERLSAAPPVDVSPASDLIRDLALRGGLTVVCLGPLTNLARFLSEHAPLREGIERVVVLGGCFAGPGSVPVLHHGKTVRLADFNFYSDPHAARAVLESFGTRLTLVPKEICDRVRIEGWEIRERLSGESFEHLILREWLRFREAQTGKSTSFCLNDPLAVLVACGACDCGVAEMRVEVGCEGVDRGVTREGSTGARVRVVRAIDVSGVRQTMWDHLFDGGARRSRRRGRSRPASPQSSGNHDAGTPAAGVQTEAAGGRGVVPGADQHGTA